MDLDQLVSVLASDEPLKLEPDMAAGSLATEGVGSKSQDVALPATEAVSQSLEEAGMAAFLKIEDGKMEANAVTRMFSDASETASVSTADVETASNAGSDATGSDAAGSDAAGSTSDALEATDGSAADGWSTPPVPPSPTHGLALPPISPAYKHVRPLAEAGRGVKQGEESPSAAFDKSELLDLLSKHCAATPEVADGAEGELRDAASSGKRCLDDATAADEGLAKRLRGGAVRA